MKNVLRHDREKKKIYAMGLQNYTFFPFPPLVVYLYMHHEANKPITNSGQSY